MAILLYMVAACGNSVEFFSPNFTGHQKLNTLTNGLIFTINGTGVVFLCQVLFTKKDII